MIAYAPVDTTAFPLDHVMPRVGAPERADSLEKMIYLANTLLQAMRDWCYAGKDGDPASADTLSALARKRIEGAWDRLDARLADARTWLVGERSSRVDLLALLLL